MVRYHTMAIPFIISLVGVLADYFTTTVGLGLGFYETHPEYNPLIALTIFWGALALLTLTLPKKKVWETSKNIFASVAFLGAVNNLLVILGFLTR